MIKRIFLIALLPLLLALQGCHKYISTSFTDEDAKWLDWVRVGETLSFRSDSGRTEDWRITNVYVTKKLRMKRFRPTLNEAYAQYDIVNCGNADVKGGVAVTRLAEKESLYVSADMDGRFVKDGEREVYLPEAFVDFEVDGRRFDDCMRFDDSNTEYSRWSKPKGDCRIVAFVVSRGYGLLWYRYEDGREFRRTNI